jgi:transcriptional regulator GlxA family with amidase domain
MTYMPSFRTSCRVRMMHSIGFVVYPSFQALGLSAATVFEIANLDRGERVYDVHILSEAGGRIAGSGAIAVENEAFGPAQFDTLILLGGTDLPITSPGLLAYVQQRSHSARRVASICTGAPMPGY